VADCASWLISRKEPRHDRLELARLKIFPHARGMSAGQEDAVQVLGTDIGIGNWAPEFVAFPHLCVCRLAVAVGSHQRCQNPKPLPGDHSRIGLRDSALGCGESHAVTSLAQGAPRNPGFSWIKVVVGQGNQDGGHAASAKL